MSALSLLTKHRPEHLATMAQNLFEPATGTYTNSQLVVILCSLLAIYNAFELLILIMITFRQYRSLYFWSLLIASFGILPYNVGFLMEYFALAPDWSGVLVDVPGWVMMVTGQSVVLYSRLHLVMQNEKILKAVLIMIIVDGVIFHTSTTIVRYAAYYGSDQINFRAAWNVIEKFQMTGFMLQEFIISGIYLYETTKLLKIMKKSNTRRTVLELFAINVFIIALDVGLLVIEYLDLIVYEQTFKGVIYSIKLKLEFAILGKLVKIVRNGRHVLANVSEDKPDFIDMTVTPQQSDSTHLELPSIDEYDFRRYSVATAEDSISHRRPSKPIISAQHLESFNKGLGV